MGFLLYLAREAVSTAIFSKMSAMKEFKIDMALEEIPVSGWTCFKTYTENILSQRPNFDSLCGPKPKAVAITTNLGMLADGNVDV